MRRILLLALAALAFVGLVCVALVLLPGSQPINVRLVKALKTHDAATLTFEIKNNTTGFYMLGMFAVLEVRNDAAWEEFYYCLVRQHTLAGHSSMTFTSQVPILPKHSALRLQLDVSKRQSAFRAFLTQMRRGINPFNKDQFFGAGTEVFSDEFLEQSLPSSPQLEPSANSPGTANEAEHAAK